MQLISAAPRSAWSCMEMKTIRSPGVRLYLSITPLNWQKRDVQKSQSIRLGSFRRQSSSSLTSLSSVKRFYVLCRCIFASEGGFSTAISLVKTGLLRACAVRNALLEIVRACIWAWAREVKARLRCRVNGRTYLFINMGNNNMHMKNTHTKKAWLDFYVLMF